MDMGRGEEWVRCMEGVTETYITMCKTDSHWGGGNLLYGSGHSNRVFVNLEGWDGEEDGREVQKGRDICILWLIHVEVWQKTTKFCRQLPFN